MAMALAELTDGCSPCETCNESQHLVAGSCQAGDGLLDARFRASNLQMHPQMNHAAVVWACCLSTCACQLHQQTGGSIRRQSWRADLSAMAYTSDGHPPVQDILPNLGIVLIQLVEFANLEEENDISVELFDCPILLLRICMTAWVLSGSTKKPVSAEQDRGAGCPHAVCTLAARPLMQCSD